MYDCYYYPTKTACYKVKEDSWPYDIIYSCLCCPSAEGYDLVKRSAYMSFDWFYLHGTFRT